MSACASMQAEMNQDFLQFVDFHHGKGPFFLYNSVICREIGFMYTVNLPFNPLPDDKF